VQLKYSEYTLFTSIYYIEFPKTGIKNPIIAFINLYSFFLGGKKIVDFGGRNLLSNPVLCLFENTIPKHDEYHQGNCEYDHGFKFSIKI